MKKFVVLVSILMALIAITAIGINAETDVSKVYGDVKSGIWYADAALYSFEQGYMNGTSDAVFSPNSNVTRGMFVTILAKMNDADTSVYTDTVSFRDAPSGKWFHNAVEWAYANGYAKGTGGGYFNPNSSVSRQDIAVMLYTYAKNTSKLDVKVNYANITVYSDYSAISGYAKEALQWAVGNGLLSGTSSTKLSPKNTATRAMISVIVRNYDKFFGHDWVQTKIITERNCTVDGVYAYHCTRCNADKTVTTKAWHTYDGGIISQNPSCTSTGKIAYVCVRCLNIKEGTVPKTAHNFVNGHCTKCTAVSNATDLVLGTWNNISIHDIEYDEYYGPIDMSITFYSNGECVTYIEGKYYKDTWYFSDVENNIWFYYLSDGSVVGFYNDPDYSTYKTLGYSFADFVYLMER